MEEQKEDSSLSNNIGRDIAVLRALLNMTQEEFSNLIFLSRVTINKVENSNLLSLDIAFRLYYITQKIINNTYFSKFTIDKAIELQNKIEKILSNSKKNNLTNI